MSAAFDPATVRTVATGLRFPEGPIALDDGSVLFVEIERGTLCRVRPGDTGVEVVADCGGGPNGAAVGPDGKIYVCNNGGLTFTTDDTGIHYPDGLREGNDGGALQRVDLDTGAVEAVFTHSGARRLGAPNDLVFDTSGACYLTDTLYGGLLYADPLSGAIHPVEEGLELPNGIGLSPDGTRLYASETYSGRVHAWDVVGPGKLEGKTLLYSPAERPHGCDGLAVDGAGNVCVASLSASGVTVIAADGTVLTRFVTPTPDSYVTNLCFGPDGRTAYVTSSGRGILYALRWPWPGLRLNFAR
ncbi:SMP-30/gluconolactonase/LRE family protein [Cryptosporangium minutisporangium]|uniref:SMP-30/gluconolactonase/LRE family protein n=1 Tax=Cryptosporangium minutisporangium TaxID=113569 RepID=A0ABP6SQP1_9ACTN